MVPITRVKDTFPIDTTSCLAVVDGPCYNYMTFHYDQKSDISTNIKTSNQIVHSELGYVHINVWGVFHYTDVIMSMIASQITSLAVVYSMVYSGADQRKTSKLRVTGLCAGNSPGPVKSPHKGPVTRKMFPFDDVIMYVRFCAAPLQLTLAVKAQWSRLLHSGPSTGLHRG